MKSKTLYLLGISLLFCTLQAAAQEEEPASKKSGKNLENPNLIKLNLFSLPLKNASVQYERAIGKKTSVAIGFRLMPEGTLPLQDVIKKVAAEETADEAEIDRQLQDFKLGNMAVTPEFRLYTGKKAMQGFYLAPYFRYANFNVNLPFEIDTEDEDGNPVTEVIPFSGNLSTIAGGLQIGAQWKLSKRIYLDWWIFGPQYGVANGSVSVIKSLTDQEQADLREEFDSFAEDISFIKLKSDIHSNGGTVKVDGPWAGIRAGLCIGIRF